MSPHAPGSATAARGADSPGPPAAAPPLFVGGTGRSGTHAMARLVGRHSRYRYISRELRFHTDIGGLPDLLDGRVDLERFLRNMREHFWRRTGADGRSRGLHDKFPKKIFEAALGEFERSFEDDPHAASAGLMRALLDPLAAEAGKAGWIEQTPQTVAAAPTLNAIFPDMRLVHMVRDGRDVACSIRRLWWGPNSASRGIRWWEKRLRAADSGTSRIPSDRVLVVRLEDLVEEDREGSYRRLLDFLDLEDEPGMRRYFERKVTTERANLGRWRRDLSERGQRRLTRAYARALERLRRDGVVSAPDPRSAAVP